MLRQRSVGTVIATLTMALTIAVTAGSARVAHAAPAVGQITSKWSGKCMEQPSWSKDINDVAVQQWDCNSGQEQQWIKIPLNVAEGTFAFENAKSYRCLSERGKESGALVSVIDCDFSKLAHSQKWKSYDPDPGPNSNSQGAHWLVNEESGKCLEDSAWNTSNGLLLTMNDCVLAWKDYWLGGV